MGPATPLPVTPSPAHYRASDADGARDVEAAVVAPRGAADRRGQVLNRIVQAKDLGAIAQLGLMLLDWAQSLPPQRSLDVRLPYSGLALLLTRAATRGGRPDGTARRVEYRPPAVSSEESQSETCGGHGSDADGDIATPSVPNPGWRLAIDSILGATAPSATEKSPVFQSGVRDRKPFKTLKVNSSPLSLNQAKERRDQVEAALEPLYDTGPFVLLCTGDSGSAFVLPVAVGENADAVGQWTAIRNASLKHSSRWRSWAGLARLELVTVRIVGPHRSRAKAYRGVFEPVDVAARLSLLRKGVKECELYTTEPPEWDWCTQTRCYHDTSSDRVIHEENCSFWDFCSEDQSCDVEDQQKRLEEISKLELIPTWPMFIADPSLAWGNDPLRDDWIYHSKNIMPRGKVIHSMAQIEFTGFRLSEWPYGRQNRVPGPFVIGGMVTFCGTIFVMRVIYGDWGIAYTAGAFFVALAGVLSTWVAGKPMNPDR
ncbi:hypothetical protein LZ32DRAFT_660451 [Colletotrichum eremochloae]|nr:hypothetical protein LZ32DRAFT_660451 [Colletotrichum eremochloae]